LNCGCFNLIKQALSHVGFCVIARCINFTAMSVL
jgi:hypothetical protein